ncbi:hypothetical protein FMUND_87 [Fusarium mundagurra]|uniref:Secreted protein n=1 Tax=Fusarium mundagurra TaxID=1567541 RepID=A0A8H5Z778_9HYPO|nr:hypothetical protein FMUND_87 [Fusarium mundagurra]
MRSKLLLLAYVACTLLHWWAFINLADAASQLLAPSVMMNDTHWPGQPHGFPLKHQSKERGTAADCGHTTPFRRQYTTQGGPALPTLLTTIPGTKHLVSVPTTLISTEAAATA